MTNVECDHCGETFNSYTAHNAHDCDRETEPVGDIFAVDELRAREKHIRAGNRWLERHGYL